MYEVEERSIHRLLGYAELLQVEAELVSGTGIDNASLFSEANSKDRVIPGGLRLLLQVDSDEPAGLSWGDAGRLFYLIHEADLVSAQFGRSRLFVQSH